MSVTDSVLLSFLCRVIVAAVIWRRLTILRVAAVLMLLAVSWFAVVSLATFGPRLAVSLRERQGKPWSEDFRDGVDAATRIAMPCHPYLLVSTLGLGIIALRRFPLDVRSGVASK